MTLTLVVLLIGVLAATRLWSARRSSNAAVLTYAVPASLIPMLAAIAAGAWFFRLGLEGIARTGHGGVSIVANMTLGWTQALMAGCFVSAGILVLASALVVRARTNGSAGDPKNGRQVMAFVLAGAAALSVTVLLAVVSDRSAMGTLTRMAPLFNVTPPAGYDSVNALTTPEWLETLERDLQLATYGGTAAFLAVVAWIGLGGGRVRALAGHLSSARGLAVVAILAAIGSAWFGLHFYSASAWLKELVR
jgi:hypothetical protein